MHDLQRSWYVFDDFSSKYGKLSHNAKQKTSIFKTRAFQKCLSLVSFISMQMRKNLFKSKYIKTGILVVSLFGVVATAHATLKSYRRADGRRSYAMTGGEREQKEIPALIKKMIRIENCSWSNSADFAANLGDEGESEDFSGSNRARLKLKGCGDSGYVCGGTMRCEVSVRASSSNEYHTFSALYDGVMCQSSNDCRDAKKCFEDAGILANEELALETYGAGHADKAESSAAPAK